MNRRVLAVGVVLAVAVAITAGAVMGVGIPGSDGESENPVAEGPDGDGQAPNGNDTTGGQDFGADGGSQGAISADSFEPPDPETYPGKLDAEHNEFGEFRDVAQDVGLTYETQRVSRAFVGTYGPYVVDFDNDGDEDLLVLGGEMPVLYENAGGEFEIQRTFDLSTASVAHFLDYNNNGHRDLLIGQRGGPPVLYENVGGEFEQRDVGFEGILSFPTTVTSADFTGNGCLDVYVGQWSSRTGRPALSLSEMHEIAEEHPDRRPTTEHGNTNHFYLGDCESFEDVTEESALGMHTFTLATSAVDFDGDGDVDLHVGNDFTGDYVFRNDGEGNFEAIDMGPNSDRNAMASEAVDVNGDHRQDIFVTNVYYENADEVVDDVIPVLRSAIPYGNNLFINQGDGEFTDVAPDHGLNRGSWGWAAAIADYTNDGHLDVIHSSTNANITAVEEHPEEFASLQVWKGTADSWEKVNGFDVGFNEHSVRGIARIDYDNDGLLDVAVVGNPAQMAGVNRDQPRAFLYENTHENDESLQFFVRNPDGLERTSEVYIETDQRTIKRVINARGDLLSQDSRMVHVGTGNENVEQVTVVWPDGTATTYDSLESGNRYVLTPEDVEQVDGD